MLGKGNGSSSILSQKRPRDDTRLSDTQLDLNTLDCPICFDAFTVPIFQCANGHLACSSCCPKLNNKCPACGLPTGHIRCRGLESVLGSIVVQCPNAKFGCTKKFSYGNESSNHENECRFSSCSCPVQDCNYTGSYKDLYCHYYDTHLECHMSHRLTFGAPRSHEMNINDKILIKREYKTRLLFAVQCFREACGVYVTVSCIGPSAPEVGKFSYHLSYATADGHTMTYKSPEMKRVHEVSYQTPKENFLLIPNSLLHGDMLSMKLCIKKAHEKRIRRLG